MHQTLSEYEQSLVQINTEVESTRGQYLTACDEIQHLKDQLDNSSEALDEKEQLLVKEVCVCVSVAGVLCCEHVVL